MSWHTPERKTEQALLRYLQTAEGSEFDGVQWHTRFCNKIKTEPRIEIICEACEPDINEAEMHTGNWTCSVEITVVSHYEEGVDATAHDEIAGQIADKLFITDAGSDALASEINKTQGDEDFKAQWYLLKTRTNTIQEHSVVTVQELEITMRPSQPA